MGRNGIIVTLFVLAMILALSNANAEVDKNKLIENAKASLQEKGIKLSDVNIIYDENNQKWEKWGKLVTENPADPNHGLLPYGVLAKKKYKTVMFDYISDKQKDIWVFMDPDTGKAIAVYTMK